MKKFGRFIIVIIMLMSVLACGKQPDIHTSDNTALPENEATFPEEVTTEAEPVTNPGLIQNSADIIIREIHTEEEPKAEISDEERGMGRVEEAYFAQEDAVRLGVSKILVVQMDESSMWGMDPRILSEFNERLVTRYGCDFVVSFVSVNPYKSKRYKGYFYRDVLEDVKNSGQQLDIMLAISWAATAYADLVSEGYFEDITDYLVTDDEGKKLYNSYPEEMWESLEVNERIYGYCPYSQCASVYKLCCNRELAEALDLDVEEGFSIYDVENILKRVDLTDEKMNDVVPIYINSEYLYGMLGYYEIGSGIFAKADADGNWTAFNATEDEAFIALWKKLREYQDNGWLKTDDSSYQKVANGKYLFFANEFKHPTFPYPINDKFVMTARTANGEKKVTHEIISGEMYYGYFDAGKEVYGITAWSEYKEEALKLITLINTEAELANFLMYGTENEHYVYEDNIVRQLTPDTPDQFGMGNRYAMVNHSITYPIYLEPQNKQEFYKEEAAKLEKSPLLECDIIPKELEELKAQYDTGSVLEQIYSQGYSKLMAGEYEDVDAAVTEINRMQKEAGIDEYIAALNAKFKK